MKSFIKLFGRAIPFVGGIICTLTALSFLITFGESASLSNLYEIENFFVFVILSLIGLPLIVFGINRLSNEASP